MNRLSSEVLNEIFILLPQEDKVECMLVCQHWKTIINALSLFQTIRISSHDNLDALTKKLQHEPEQRAKLENLIIDIRYEEEVYLDPILSLLPNLRVLHSPNYKNHPTINEEEVYYPWKESIEYFSEYSENPILLRIISSSICPNLKTLRTSNLDVQSVPLLKNAPSLRYLTLDSDAISLTYFELIHQSLPFLHSLTLKATSLKRCDLDCEIKPAFILCNFALQTVYAMELDTKISLLQYITSKYLNLSILKINIPNYFSIDDISVHDLYTRGWEPLLLSLKNKLEVLDIDHTFVNSSILDLLNECNSEIKRLTIGDLGLDRLGQIYQLLPNIQYLHIDAINLAFSSTFNWLNNLTVLKKLKITHAFTEQAYEPIKLNDLLKSFPPTLKSLSLKYVNMSFDLKSEIHPTFINKLSFKGMELPDGLDLFLSANFTQLSKLKFWRCSLGNSMFSLPHCRIKTFQIEDEFTKENRGILITTIRNQRWYTTTYIESRYDHVKQYNGVPRQHQAVRSHEIVGNVQEKPFFTLHCHSLYNIVIFDVLNC